MLISCSGQVLSHPDEMAAFDEAGPVKPVVDHRQLTKAHIPTGPYRVVAGDLLSLTMPQVARALDTATSNGGKMVSRVGDDGTITLPAIGHLHVAGMDLKEIEEAVVNAFHPKYVIERPMVVAEIEEHQTQKVAIVGAVESPGVYDLRTDEMSLVTLLMKAGGNLSDGSGAVRIYRAGGADPEQRLGLPIEGLELPFADVTLKGGDTVDVERLNPNIFTVIGLVNTEGTFPYPRGVQYNLWQAIGSAGGIKADADPRYVKILRQDTAGKIVSATVKIGPKAEHKRAAYDLSIKPGDVIALDHTPRTLVRQMFAQIVSIQTAIRYDLNPSRR